MNNNLFNKIKKKWQTVAILIFMVVAIVFSISVFIPARYSSEIKMIIIQNHESADVDAFSAAKSAEYLSDIISNVIYTESFMQDMLDAPFEVEKDFSYSAEKRMKIWEKTVDVKKENNTGILNVTVLDRSRGESEAIAESIAWGLNTRGSKYHGGGTSIEIKTIDGPITSERPATPNVLLNTLLALVIGIVGSISAVYFFDDFELLLFEKKSLRRREALDEDDNQAKKIVANLKKIRDNLKNQKLTSSVVDDYSIEELDKPKKEVLDKDLFSEQEMYSGSEELANEIQPEKMEQEANKEVIPENLPIFQAEEKIEKKEAPVDIEEEIEKKSDKGFVTMEELNKEAERMGLADKKEETSVKFEATSEEVKERLNKLLRGEL